MQSGSASSAICLPHSKEEDRLSTPCATSCPWRYLPANFPPWKQSSIISGAYAILGTWCRPAFCPAERRLWASAEIRSRLCDHGCGIRVKTVEEFAGICGFDAHKSVKGRKRHILVDTLGLLLLVYDTPADLHDIRGARACLPDLPPAPTPRHQIRADAGNPGAEVSDVVTSRG